MHHVAVQTAKAGESSTQGSENMAQNNPKVLDVASLLGIVAA